MAFPWPAAVDTHLLFRSLSCWQTLAQWVLRNLSCVWSREASSGVLNLHMSSPVEFTRHITTSWIGMASVRSWTQTQTSRPMMSDGRKQPEQENDSTFHRNMNRLLNAKATALKNQGVPRRIILCEKFRWLIWGNRWLSFTHTHTHALIVRKLFRVFQLRTNHTSSPLSTDAADEALSKSDLSFLSFFHPSFYLFPTKAALHTEGQIPCHSNDMWRGQSCWRDLAYMASKRVTVIHFSSIWCETSHHHLFNEEKPSLGRINWNMLKKPKKQDLKGKVKLIADIFSFVATRGTHSESAISLT